MHVFHLSLDLSLCLKRPAHKSDFYRPIPVDFAQW